MFFKNVTCLKIPIKKGNICMVFPPYEFSDGLYLQIFVNKWYLPRVNTHMTFLFFLK